MTLNALDGDIKANNGKMWKSSVKIAIFRTGHFNDINKY